MEKIGEIGAAIKQIDVKKEILRKSFLHLQSQSQSQSQSQPLGLNWTDLDSYFTTLRSSLESEFNHLQTLYPSSDILKSLCHNSDGLGLRRFIIHTPTRFSLLAQLPDAYRCTPDAAAMVLDAMVGFYSDTEVRFLKHSCVIMLEGLMRVKPDVTLELKEKAMTVAVEWNRKRINAPMKERADNTLGFLLLVVAYGLIDGFHIDELISCIVFVAKKRQTLDLCRQIIPANKINDVIQKLINKGMGLVAVKYSIEFEKTKEFPLVSLLEEQKSKCMRIIDEMCKNEKNVDACNQVVMKEVKTLKLIMKCINANRLEPEYPKDTVLAFVKELNNRLVKKPENEEEEEEEQEEQEQLSKKQKLNTIVAVDVPTTTTSENVNSLLAHLLPGHVSQSPNAGSTGVNPMVASGSKTPNRQQPKTKTKPKTQTQPRPKAKASQEDMICFHCGETGHWRRNCSKYLEEVKKSKAG